MMDLTDAQENLRCAGFDLIDMAADTKEKWGRCNGHFNFIEFYKNPDESEWRAIIQTDSCTELEALYIHERLEELNEPSTPVNVYSVEHIKTDIQNIYLVKLDCLHNFVVGYPAIPTNTKECPICKHPIFWELYPARDWWKEDNNEQS